MPDPATATPAAATPTPTPEAKPQPKTMADILARANARAAGAPANDNAKPEPKVEAKPEDKKPDAPAAAELKTFTKLQREKRELETRLKKLEAETKDAAVALEAQKLLGEGKKLEALAKLTGKDPTEELTALLESYIAEPGDKAAENDLAKKVEEISATIAADKKADEEKEAKAVTAQAQSMVGRVLTGAAEKYELCARKENRDEAIAAAIDGAVYLAGERKIDLSTLSEDETNALIEEAFAGVEAVYDSYGKRYSKTPKPTTTSAESVARGTVTTTPPTGKPRTLEEVMARARERAIYTQ